MRLKIKTINLHIPTRFSIFKSKLRKISSTAIAIDCPDFPMHLSSRNDDFKFLSDLLMYLIAAPENN